MATFTSSLKPSLIYVFAISDEAHKGCLKIGETTLDDDTDTHLQPNSDVLNEAACKRIDQYTRTAGIAYQLLHTELTLHNSHGQVCSFHDRQVHRVLERSGVRRKVFDAVRGANEWYCCDLETVRNAIVAIKEGRESLNPHEISDTPAPTIVLRPEQLAAIEKTKMRFQRGSQMLWNAKMRFGKTLCALRVAKELEMKRTLIVTHRPVVDEGWFDDFKKTFYDRKDYHYGSRGNGESFESLEELAKGDGKYVYFASMQDMRGSEQVGGKFDKNNKIFSAHWNFLIIDEAHEGTLTELGKAVIAELTKNDTKVLRLSGTPFNLIGDHKEEEIFTWDYTMEQKAKKEWDLTHFGDPNPYAPLPAINIYTYDLARLIPKFGDEEKAFNFHEFFRTYDNGNFVYNQDVDNFLNLLCKGDAESLYPYANKTFRKTFRHTLWVIPGVRSARTLAMKLRNHPIFGAFTVVNVAGDGDEAEGSHDALQTVKEAIGPDSESTYTITLSCGRLTTGVTIPPWTAVFMMAGTSSTSAASYMQTLFRVQTPYSHNGRMKSECYAFDFAPDRTLRILAETVKVSAKAGKQTHDDRKTLDSFLNFCPVISIDGSQMKPYNVDNMLAQLKRAQIENVVQKGFEDGALYNDELLKLSDIELKDFSRLKGIIGCTNAMPHTNDIDINRQGLTNEQYDEKKRIEKKKKNKRTPEEEERLKQLNAAARQRKEAISILHGISIRMPLMIYGAELTDEESELTIENLTNLIDDQSWKEFMPQGVDKKLFDRFKKYYDPDIFREAGKRIREMARMADQFTIEQRIERITAIFNTFRNPDKETVLTPWRVVNRHLANCLGGYCFYDEQFKAPLTTPRYIKQGDVTGQVFGPNSVILEINSKSGLYPLYAAYSIYRARLEAENIAYENVRLEISRQLWDFTLGQNIYVVCKTPMARNITRRTLAGFRDNVTVNAQYYKNLIETLTQSPDDVTKRLTNGRLFWESNNKEKMKIDAIVGNPPYQVMNQGNGNGSDPIYHKFLDLAMELAPQGTLIHPARFLFNAGKTPKEWNKKMLGDRHYKIVDYWARSTEVFPTVDVKGGIAVSYWNREADFEPIGFFSPFEELRGILSKVQQSTPTPLSNIIEPRELYRITRTLYDEHPDMECRQSDGHKFSLGANIFDIFPELFNEEPAPNEEYARILGRHNNERCYRWCKSSYISHPDNFTKYKVVIPKANGTGAIGEVLSTPLVGEPLVGYTDTFIAIGRFDTLEVAEACMKYVKTRFARTMLGTLKTTQDNPRETWRNVPMQDFTANSDIDWQLPVAEIDRLLYKKYRLDETEIAFIEEKVRAME